MDVRVPVCPICQKPVPANRGEDPNIRMNEHIQNNCSDLRSKNDNTCRKKGCTTKMLVPMQCPECGLSFCVKHRLAIDHQCKGKGATLVNNSKLLSSTNHKLSSSKPQSTSRVEMERQRLSRVHKQKQEIARLQQKVKQGTITDNEQVQLAKLLSMKNDNNKDGKCIIC
ncbi:uncharacterized protein BX663DRAFT_529834 [Cokeromyces recurvatus]|uniref:uncharacterized protein n=1 Tax=Cokeromyces recurvatus TaxID=90255 RepID=UPI00221FE9AB|nr:uncharacterized protein BX663DRAFT_529834 [Cokeromyces recurvatus]KAI7905755.1 hypothetical protein BX663DRAFT_529834 [Cokeromyces recurvatus]